MEFPNIGSQCSIVDCQQLDFLPITCSTCKLVFCKDHFNEISHSCSKFNNEVDINKSIISYECSQNGCSEKSVIQMLCSNCNHHLCLLHRHHDCLGMSELNKLKNLEQKKQTDEFLKAKSNVDREIAHKLNKFKNHPTAIKVQLMKLKGKSIGPKNIPVVERCYLNVHPPINTQAINISKNLQGVFVSINWSIGKVIDSIADSLNIPNMNNQSTLKKLRLFNYYTGSIVTNEMSQILSELLSNKGIINGQDVILEYSENEVVENQLYK